MTEWISVKDKLPEDRDWVLVWHTAYKTPKKAKYKDDFGFSLPIFILDGANSLELEGEVTHWMPLPNAPYIEKAHAKWIKTLDEVEIYDYVYECSVCGGKEIGNDDIFCPWCGTKMDKE